MIVLTPPDKLAIFNHTEVVAHKAWSMMEHVNLMDTTCQNSVHYIPVYSAVIIIKYNSYLILKYSLLCAAAQRLSRRQSSRRLWSMMSVDATDESIACCDRRRRCALRDLCVACRIMPQTLGEQTDKPWFVQAAGSLYRFAVSPAPAPVCGLA